MAPFKSSRGRNLGKFVEGFKTSTIGQGLGGGGDTVSITGGSAITPGDGYTYHVFTHPLETDDLNDPAVQTFQVVGDPITIDIFVIGGGGGGGSGYYGGGGGGGGVIKGIGYQTASTPNNIKQYNVEVGNGGRGGILNPGTSPNEGNTGGTSKFDDIHILGGGGGGAGPGGNGGPGTNDGANAGGASAYTNTGTSTPYSVPGSTNPNGTWTYYSSSRPTNTPAIYGGDGAGATASNRTGGNGVQMPEIPSTVITPLALIANRMGSPNDYYAAGGSGYGYPNPTAGNNNGGGGESSPGDISSTGSGANGIGGGGGGSGNPRNEGGRGGSGIVIIRRDAD